MIGKFAMGWPSGSVLASAALLAALAITGATSVGAEDAQAVIDRAKANVTKFAGPQTVWEGPTSGPAPRRQEDRLPVGRRAERHLASLRRLHQGSRREDRLEVTIIDGKGSPTSWLAGMNQAIALKPDGIALFADAASLQDPIKAGVAQGIKFVGLHAAGHAGPAARPQSLRQHPGGLRARSARPRPTGSSPIRTARRTSSSSATTNTRSPRSNRWRPRPRSRNAPAARCSTTSTRRPPRRRSASRS